MKTTSLTKYLENNCVRVLYVYVCVCVCKRDAADAWKKTPIHLQVQLIFIRKDNDYFGCPLFHM